MLVYHTTMMAEKHQPYRPGNEEPDMWDYPSRAQIVTEGRGSFPGGPVVQLSMFGHTTLIPRIYVAYTCVISCTIQIIVVCFHIDS